MQPLQILKVAPLRQRQAAKTRIFDQISQAQVDYMLSKIPKARFVELSELAAMVAWLSSDDCSFSTGAVFDISGGRATY